MDRPDDPRADRDAASPQHPPRRTRFGAAGAATGETAGPPARCAIGSSSPSPGQRACGCIPKQLTRTVLVELEQHVSGSVECEKRAAKILKTIDDIRIPSTLNPPSSTGGLAPPTRGLRASTGWVGLFSCALCRECPFRGLRSSVIQTLIEGWNRLAQVGSSKRIWSPATSV